MLMNLKPLYESFHNVVIPEEVIDYIIELSNRYIQNMRNPDKSIDIMDEVCVKASLESKNKDDKTLELNNKVKKIIQEKIRQCRNKILKKHLDSKMNNIS